MNTGQVRMETLDTVSLFHLYCHRPSTLAVLSDLYYPEERQRLQHAVIISSPDLPRPAVEQLSSQAVILGGTMALKYKDIELYACRNSEYPGGVKLGMLI